MGKVSREALEKGTGSDGERALVAVDGKVFDVSGSALWKGGKHMNSHEAGRDLSREIMASPHGTGVLGRVPQVGDLEASSVETGAVKPSIAKPVPVWAAAILSKHPHPVSVHFPIALSVAGAVFTAIGLVLGNAVMESAGLFDLAFGALAAPGAIAAGLLSWKYNYGGTMTGKFRLKIVLSAVYILVAWAAVAIRLLVPSAAQTGTVPQIVYTGLVLALPVAALGLGYVGGTITFPKKWEG